MIRFQCTLWFHCNGQDLGRGEEGERVLLWIRAQSHMRLCFASEHCFAASLTCLYRTCLDHMFKLDLWGFPHGDFLMGMHCRYLLVALACLTSRSSPGALPPAGEKQ
jgi:hypothetical protein